MTQTVSQYTDGNTDITLCVDQITLLGLNGKHWHNVNGKYDDYHRYSFDYLF